MQVGRFAKDPGYLVGCLIHSLKLTYPLKMVVSNRNLLFQGSIFRGYVSFREGIGDEILPNYMGIFFFYKANCKDPNKPIRIQWNVIF